MANATISVRTDDKLKAEATDLFANLGMDMSTAINIFLRAAVKSSGIPFPIAEEPDEAYKALIAKTIAERLERSKDPDTKWVSHEDMKKKFVG